jgi:hypothetical protein
MPPRAGADDDRICRRKSTYPKDVVDVLAELVLVARKHAASKKTIWSSISKAERL